MKMYSQIYTIVFIAGLMLGAPGVQATLINVEPDDFAAGADLTNAFSGVTFTFGREIGRDRRTLTVKLPNFPHNI